MRRAARAARARRVVLAGGLLLAACGDDGTGPSGADAPPAVAPGGTATSAGPGGGEGSEDASPGTSPAATATTGAGAPATTAGDGTGSPGRFPSTLDAEVAPGRFAPALLRPGLSERLVVEVHADVRPAARTLDHLATLLGDVSGKPVAVVDAGAPGGGARDWTAGELVAAADAGSTTGQGNGVAVVRLLFVRGTYDGDEGVLGVAVRGDAAAIFVDRVRAAGGLLGGSEGIEVAVTAHELGHLLGLVDLFVDTGRADPEHPGHSSNPESVMYWAVESDLVGQLLGANPPNDFDADDRADLARIRDGG